MRILNLYAGIGGNRKLWGDDHSVTAIELNPDLAKVYAANFPNDHIFVCDAHRFLIENFKDYDMIWSSPPCPTHSRARFWGSKGGTTSLKYPDLKLYEEIIFLQHYYSGLWVVENVISYYEPLILPVESNRHYFWSNFKIRAGEYESTYFSNESKELIPDLRDMDLTGLKGSGLRRMQILRNCVHPKLGLDILNCALGKFETEAVNQLKLEI
jgi:DNA (cytosine-5)-methyltransferase 1